MLFKHISPINQELINKQILKEAKLKASERTDYGIPSQKKYPIPDKAHVLAAIRMFNHVDKEHEAELAHNIIKKMDEYDIPYDTVGPTNRLRKYLPKQSTQEATTNLQQLGHMGKVIADYVGLDQQYWLSVKTSDAKKLDKIQVQKIGQAWLILIFCIIDLQCQILLDDSLARMSKKAMTKAKRNKKFKTFMNNTIKQVYDKHKDYQPCSFKQFQNTGYWEYLKTGYKDRTLKELAITFWRRATQAVLIVLLYKALPKIMGMTSISLILLSAIPVKMILSYLGIKVAMGAVDNQVFDFYGRTVQMAVDFTTNGLQLARPQLYSFKTYKDGSQDLVMTDLPEIPKEIYVLTDKEILDKCKEVTEKGLTWFDLKQLVDKYYGTLKNI